MLDVLFTKSVLFVLGLWVGVLLFGWQSPEKEKYDLLRAVAAGDTSKVRRHIEKGTDLNKGEYVEQTPLHIAIAFQQEEVVKLLLESKRVNITHQNNFFGESTVNRALRAKKDTKGDRIVQLIKKTVAEAEMYVNASDPPEYDV